MFLLQVYILRVYLHRLIVLGVLTELPYFLVIRRISLISTYLLLSACRFPDLSTHFRRISRVSTYV